MAHEPAKNYEEAVKKLQALIVADSFDNNFGPILNPKVPQCMLEVAGVPNLHYIIEYLILNQVKEIIIASKGQRESIKDFCKKRQYKIKCTAVGISSDAMNFGDVLRQVAEMRLIKDDFVLIRGDIISNIELKNALKFHYQIK